MAEPALKVSASAMGDLSRPDLQRYATRLRQLDKNNDGQLSLDEVCEAVDIIINQEKQQKLLKWIIAALTVFCLLTVAATVGLTYAVVHLSKDTSVSGSALVAKNSGETLRTGNYLAPQGAASLTANLWNSSDPGLNLALLTSIKVPSANPGEVFTVHRVASATLLANSSVLVRSISGETFVVSAAAVQPTSAESNTTVPSQRRRSLLLVSSTDFTLTVTQGGRSHVLAGVKSSDTIGTIKDKVFAAGGPPKDTQVLKDGTKTLEDANTLSFYKIKNAATISMVVITLKINKQCPPDMMCIAVFAPVAVSLPATDTIAGVKREIAWSSLSVPMVDQILTKPDVDGALKDDQTLGFYNILEQTQLNLDVSMEPVMYQ